MSLTDIAARIREGLAGKGFDGSMKFDCGEDGVIVLADGTATTDDRDTDCTIRLSRDTLVKLLSGQLNPMTGVMMGKLKVSGDMGVALGLGRLLAR
ncbi:SCP2 sterol-binding domain-containing protein [Roseicyclus persicicus]|uniref:SCP2 sterol-binding domain-containing protein n=1 Tax=Roseicyclus persicicus TaxID=2650661 RepID=A0A7X6JZA1_9RHOB|nr:SCP2 sterol-binding domain-containing protein [Roseibacterium persicicum]NKX44950.1 SCP2 sterol-binding domain-containing protein [Roseibacterium persicicum]